MDCKLIDSTIRFQLAKVAHPKDAWDYLAYLCVTTPPKDIRWSGIRNAHQGEDSIHVFYVIMTTLSFGATIYK